MTGGRETKKRNHYLEIIFIIVLTVIIIGIAVFFFLKVKPDLSNSATAMDGKLTAENLQTDSMEHLLITEEEEISGETVSSGIRDLGELVTADYYYTHAENYDSSKQALGLKLPLTTTSFVYMVDGDIKAGVDFSTAAVEMDKENKTVRITLSEPKIISSEIDHDSFQVVSQQNSIFNSLDASDVNYTFEDVKKTEEHRAIEKGLLVRAKDNTVRLLDSFVRNSLQMSDYTIELLFAGA